MLPYYIFNIVCCTQLGKVYRCIDTVRDQHCADYQLFEIGAKKQESPVCIYIYLYIYSYHHLILSLLLFLVTHSLTHVYDTFIISKTKPRFSSSPLHTHIQLSNNDSPPKIKTPCFDPPMIYLSYIPSSIYISTHTNIRSLKINLSHDFPISFLYTYHTDATFTHDISKMKLSFFYCKIYHLTVWVEVKQKK